MNMSAWQADTGMTYTPCAFVMFGLLQHSRVSKPYPLGLTGHVIKDLQLSPLDIEVERYMFWIGKHLGVNALSVRCWQQGITMSTKSMRECF